MAAIHSLYCKGVGARIVRLWDKLQIVKACVLKVSAVRVKPENRNRVKIYNQGQNSISEVIAICEMK